MTQRVSTHLMFQGTAGAALELYAATFPQFAIARLEKYGAGEPGPEGTVKRADVSFNGHTLIVIDSPVTHAFTFTPAMSLFVDFESGGELDAAFASLST